MKIIHILRGSAFISAVMLGSITGHAQTAEELLESGREAFLDYRFNEASRLYGQARAKARKGDEDVAERLSVYLRQLQQAENFLGRVEAIEIIDSIAVPRDGFFSHYRLPSSSGRLGGKDQLPDGVGNAESDYVFTSERGNYKLWAQPSDSTGYMTLVESSRLTDGSWSAPAELDPELGDEGDAIYPFMMADGVTLYYAANGENSIGGYDIMVATRDASDGTFMQPSNLGFPYNSPYDDYLLAIDELNNVGWWATDRNNLDDMITIYVFIPQELRKNYPADEENIVELARISDYMLSQPLDADHNELIDRISAIRPTREEKPSEFHLTGFDGRVYTRYEDLPSAAARTAVRKYESARQQLEKNEKALLSLRENYSRRRSAETGNRIARAEQEIEAERSEVNKLRSEVYRALRQ
ncbi:MAG: hypothetical protein K2N88_06365 [Muribaculaceae bacterium]|nr:hypothetical protein [Muribaculaceae bacterium]